MKRPAVKKSTSAKKSTVLSPEDHERLRRHAQERDDAWGSAAMALEVAARAVRVAMRMRGKNSAETSAARAVAEAAMVQLLDSVRADLAPFIVSADCEPRWLAYQAARLVALHRD